jgi:hypothetical protein
MCAVPAAVSFFPPAGAMEDPYSTFDEIGNSSNAAMGTPSSSNFPLSSSTGSAATWHAQRIEEAMQQTASSGAGGGVCIEDCYGSFDDQAAPALAHSMSEMSFKQMDLGLVRGDSLVGGPERATRGQSLGQGMTHSHSSWGRLQSGRQGVKWMQYMICYEDMTRV